MLDPQEGQKSQVVELVVECEVRQEGRVPELSVLNIFASVKHELLVVSVYFGHSIPSISEVLAVVLLNLCCNSTRITHL